ncbi:uncharacterized protein PGTG_22802 [Puccinia graminis f. sp. tritici CRL 75-36-700-3]|uniref:Hydrophobin n=1 Tax=Puccinia graminis f. sp. tritici (strain CRL 75-36-700-3 / race SCCL) TaxID=418459 RepID=H6QVN1_PUCGT|nr:uncharacterized protein PGTG_22802 [Puccinia graminis f. sp. tritici CRL 75-36-700-3]EHS63418.1 hypothetical protein PGTG_22802 [Puccinia graminis f. sp. tritici CRL 75-36-700-3]
MNFNISKIPQAFGIILMMGMVSEILAGASCPSGSAFMCSGNSGLYSPPKSQTCNGSDSLMCCQVGLPPPAQNCVAPSYNVK